VSQSGPLAAGPLDFAGRSADRRDHFIGIAREGERVATFFHG